jgi:hypothetical protein
MNKVYWASAAAGLGVLAVYGTAFAQTSAPPASAPTTSATPGSPSASSPAPQPSPAAAPPTSATTPGSFAFPSTTTGLSGFGGGLGDGLGNSTASPLAPSDPTAILTAIGVASSYVSHVRVTPSVTVSYDSNVVGASQIVGAQQGLRSGSDESISPSLNLDIAQSIGRGSVFLGGGVGYNFYMRDTLLNREEINLRGGYLGSLGGCHGGLTAGYQANENELTDLTRGAIQDTYYLETVGLNASCGGSIGFAPLASISESWSQNSLSALSSSDLRTFSASAGLAYQTPTNGTASVFGQYQTTDFPNRNLGVGGVGLGSGAQDGYKLYAGGIKYSRNLGARIQGSVSASYSLVDSEGASNGFKGFTYSTSISYRATSRLSFLASFARQVTPSNVLDASYQVENDNSLQATYSHGNRWSITAGVDEVVGRQNGSALTSAIDLLNFDTKSVFAIATYSLRRINLSLSLSHDDRTTNQSLLNYSDTRASITASTTF